MRAAASMAAAGVAARRWPRRDAPRHVDEQRAAGRGRRRRRSPPGHGAARRPRRHPGYPPRAPGTAGRARWRAPRPSPRAPWRRRPGRRCPGWRAQPLASRATRSASGSAGAPDAGVGRDHRGPGARAHPGSMSGTGGTRSGRRDRAAARWPPSRGTGWPSRRPRRATSYSATAYCAAVEPMSPRLASAMNGRSAGMRPRSRSRARTPSLPQRSKNATLTLTAAANGPRRLQDQLAEPARPRRRVRGKPSGSASGSGSMPRHRLVPVSRHPLRQPVEIPARARLGGPSVTERRTLRRCVGRAGVSGRSRRRRRVAATGRRVSAARLRWSAGMNQAGGDCGSTCPSTVTAWSATSVRLPCEVEGHHPHVDIQAVDVEVRDLVAVGRPLGREAAAVGGQARDLLPGVAGRGPRCRASSRSSAPRRCSGRRATTTGWHSPSGDRSGVFFLKGALMTPIWGAPAPLPPPLASYVNAMDLPSGLQAGSLWPSGP